MKTLLAIMLTGSILSAQSVPTCNSMDDIIGKQALLERVSKNVKHISPDELQKMIDTDVEFFLIDIREQMQSTHGEIFYSDAIIITRGYLELKIGEKIPNTKAKIVVYCCTGHRSILAVRSLQEMGYTNVFSLDGGIQGWVESGKVLDTVYGEMIVKE